MNGDSASKCVDVHNYDFIDDQIRVKRNEEKNIEFFYIALATIQCTICMVKLEQIMSFKFGALFAHSFRPIRIQTKRHRKKAARLQAHSYRAATWMKWTNKYAHECNSICKYNAMKRFSVSRMNETGNYIQTHTHTYFYRERDLKYRRQRQTASIATQTYCGTAVKCYLKFLRQSSRSMHTRYRSGIYY